MSKSAKRKPFRIGDQEVAAGHRRTFDLPIADMYTHTTVTMPIKVIHGRRDGPVCFLSGALHGDEINGIEIVRREKKSAFAERKGGF